MPDRPVVFFPEIEAKPAPDIVESPRRSSAYQRHRMDSKAATALRMSATAPVSRRGSPRTPTRARILFYNKTDPHYGFTNFSSHPVFYDNKRYPTSEHLFQSFKVSGTPQLIAWFLLIDFSQFQPHRPRLAEHIRTCSERPSVAFSEARRFQPEVRSDWKDVNIQMVFILYFLKMYQ
jgi:diaminohydroxyphosphoribosylaminopyrimidine deaminase/5-amino-6-(5-phosphoribosylamino)uracil reductase